MTASEFIALERNVFKKLGMERSEIMKLICEKGNELRSYAEKNNYKVTEEELIRICLK